MLADTSFPFQMATGMTSQLGMLDLESPMAWLHHPGEDAVRTHTPKPYYSKIKEPRDLGSNDYSSYLVDEDGNAYEPYSLAWRYLGMFIECEEENNEDDDNSGSNEEERRRLSGDEGDGNGCARKVLWAAYHDPEYSGGTIGEYQYFNQTARTYDDSYCRADRCVKLDCHEPDTHFELVGVFKETDGLYDFAEQLFKHQGYCLWDYDTYSLMSTYREYMPDYCKQLYFPDDYGDVLYMDLRPEKGGDISLGVYTDERCTKKSRLTIQQYIQMFYDISGDEEKGQKIARAWSHAIKRWNKHMNVYKTCQPCRAYNLQGNGNGGSGDGRRFLDEDGDGDEEQWGYDCYDDAGYTNCYQCYKFESKTDMEPATIDDLKAASRQGTILEIRVDGKRYGRGGFHKQILPQWAKIVISAIGGIAVLGLFTLAWKRVANSAMLGTFFQWIRDRFNRKDLPNAFKEHFHIEDERTVDFEEDDGFYSKKPLSYVYESD